MTSRKPRTVIIRIVLALLCTLGTAASVSVATQNSAQAATCTPTFSKSAGVWYVPYGCNGVGIPGSHKCQYTGAINESVGLTETVECADIVATNTSSATQIWGEGEFYCQGAYVECQAMSVSVYDIVGATYGSPTSHYGCNGTCSDGGRAMVSTAHFTANRADCYGAFSVDPADGEFGDPQIIKVAGVAFHALPELDSNYVYVCFD